MPLPMMTPYNGTMHAVVGMTETLDLELKTAAPSLGATVLCPGLVETPLAANSAALKPVGAAAPPTGEDGAEVDTTQYGSVLSPTEVAESAIAAIEEGRVHAIVGRDAAGMARARVESVLADIPPVE
jgi:short-subunit dehydrogenase